MTQRVNQIQIEIREVFNPGKYGESNNLGSEAKVYYEWGKPLGLIEVSFDKTYEDKFAKTSKKSISKSQFILRTKVADNQFFFPPDP